MTPPVLGAALNADSAVDQTDMALVTVGGNRRPGLRRSVTSFAVAIARTSLTADREASARPARPAGLRMAGQWPTVSGRGRIQRGNGRVLRGLGRLRKYRQGCSV